MSFQRETPKSATAAPSTNGGTGRASLPTRQFLPRIVPFGTYMAFIVIADLLLRAGMSAEDLLWLYPVKILLVLVALWCYRKRYNELVWQRLGAVQWIEAVAVGVVVLVLWVNLDASWMQVGTSTGYAPLQADGSINWLLVGFRIAGAALVVPVMEELFWRSFLMRWLERSDFTQVKPANVRLFAFCATAVLFGIEHNLWFAGIVAGIGYGLLYMRTGNIWSAIIAHAITNGLLGAWILMTSQWAYW